MLSLTAWWVTAGLYIVPSKPLCSFVTVNSIRTGYLNQSFAADEVDWFFSQVRGLRVVGLKQ